MPEPVVEPCDGLSDQDRLRLVRPTAIEPNAVLAAAGTVERLHGALAVFGVGAIELSGGRVGLVFASDVVLEVADPRLYAPEQAQRVVEGRRRQLVAASAELRALHAVRDREDIGEAERAPGKHRAREDEASGRRTPPGLDVSDEAPAFLGDETAHEQEVAERATPPAEFFDADIEWGMP